MHGWARPLRGGDVALGLVNLGGGRADAEVGLAALFGEGAAAASALDVWTGTHGRVEGRVAASLAAHEATLLRLTPA